MCAISPCRGLHFQHSRPVSATAGWNFWSDLTRCLLISGCGQSHVSVKDGWNYFWEQFWAQQPNRTETRIHLRAVGLCWCPEVSAGLPWSPVVSREWKWLWEENLDPKELSSHYNYCKHFSTTMSDRGWIDHMWTISCYEREVPQVATLANRYVVSCHCEVVFFFNLT